MKENKIPKIDCLTILISAFLINMFRVNFISERVQQLFVWGSSIIFDNE